MQINGETRLIGFFGSTYRTSKMYAMYNAAMRELNLNCLYVPFVVDNLAHAVEGVRHLGIAAVGVTIPYKVEIMPFLDELDADAARCGAVNVVVNSGGRLVGYNTDGRGALRALEEQTPVRGQRVTLLGAGGAPRAIAVALCDADAEVFILNRTRQHAIELAEMLGHQARAGDLADLSAALDGSSILINTTSVGMVNTPTVGHSLVPPELLRPGMTVMEIVSAPRHTRLTEDAQERGCTVVYGDRMLLWQGVDKFRLYTGVEPPIDVMARAMEATS